jgi:hypothetical protein
MSVIFLREYTSVVDELLDVEGSSTVLYPATEHLKIRCRMHRRERKIKKSMGATAFGNVQSG